MSAPVAAPVTQEFGDNPGYYSQFGLLGHEGRDYGCGDGTPIYAALGGVVGIASDAYGNYGRCIIIHHPDGGGTIYAHLQYRFVAAGQYVDEGQEIALSNNTGNSSGPHLHWGYQPSYLANLGNGYWGCADPRILLAGASQDVTEVTDLRTWLTQTQVQVEQTRMAHAAKNYLLYLVRSPNPSELDQWKDVDTETQDSIFVASEEYQGDANGAGSVWQKYIPGYPKSEINKKVAARASAAIDLLGHFQALASQGDSGAAQKIAQIQAIINSQEG